MGSPVKLCLIAIGNPPSEAAGDGVGTRLLAEFETCRSLAAQYLLWRIPDAHTFFEGRGYTNSGIRRHKIYPKPRHSVWALG
jgi:hypothetical protein